MLRVALLTVFACYSTLSIASQIDQAWVQYGPRGVEVRAITADAVCPTANIDGKMVAMTQRSAPNDAYPARSCQLDLPGKAQRVSVFSSPLTLPKADPQTIVILGDTGCRMKGKLNAGGVFQACNDPTSWPFSLISEVAAQQKPDLVIHVGDYHYRETACPDDNSGCTGSPFGDNLAVWQADLLRPAATLLRTAPWIFVRGNHEECVRGGKGWSRLLDPQSFDAEHACNPTEGPWLARLTGLNLGIIDNSSIGEGAVDTGVAESIAAQLHNLDEQTGKTPLWVFMHRPVRSVVNLHKGEVNGGNATLAAGFDKASPTSLQYIWSGHQHSFQILDWQDGSAPQIVAGHGGDVLDRDAPTTLDGLAQLGKTISQGWSQIGDFGFVVLKKQDGNWVMSNHNRFGAVTMRCTLAKTIACTPAI